LWFSLYITFCRPRCSHVSSSFSYNVSFLPKSA
jgi:hypothetical protein